MNIEPPVLRECPVCRRFIRMTRVAVLVHSDKGPKRQVCPMSGQPSPSRWRGVRAVVA